MLRVVGAFDSGYGTGVGDRGFVYLVGILCRGEMW